VAAKLYRTVSTIWNFKISEHRFSGRVLFVQNDFMPVALLTTLIVTNATFERISRMCGKITAIFVSFVSFVPVVFKTCTHVCRIESLIIPKQSLDRRMDHSGELPHDHDGRTRQNTVKPA
jgi:hypothetical protein